MKPKPLVQQTLSGVKHIIAIASGKGGVGKSTTAVNLAFALQQQGMRVGILDADIYGPSQPMLLGARSRPGVTADKKLQPIVVHGVQSMSIGYLVDESASMAWRGPMATSALQQMLYDTQWDCLDYLLIDLPPGTGDIQLTLAQKVPVTAALIVTTPQDLALLDARRACQMFQKVRIPVLGIVENMSLHTCSQCGHAEPVFGVGGGKKLAAEYGVTLLGALPLDQAIYQQAEAGVPLAVAHPEGSAANSYRQIAQQMIQQVDAFITPVTTDFPVIEIKND